MHQSTPYAIAQSAIADLKAAVYLLLKESPDGLKNVEIGKRLGIHAGHVQHKGHIPRTILAMMEAEGVVQQDAASKTWALTTVVDSED